MSSPKTRADDLMLVNAHIDGELDASAALAFERRMAKDEALQAAHSRVAALRSAMAAKLRQEPVSESLQQKIDSAIGERRPVKALNYSWRQMAASILVAALAGSGATFFGLQQFSQPNSFDAIMAGHERSLLAATPVDVASSDHHTVRPWFDQRLALSPPVPELSAAGYVLQGGRVDIVGGKPVPTLVYKLKQHLISLVAVPGAGGSDDRAAATFATRDGYSVLSWVGRDFAYSAVSDVAKSDLEDFQTKWRAASEAD
jgi:anti-sigma factor RsiW